MTDRILGAVTLIGMTMAMFAALIFAPTEATMGVIQRIFYFHVPAGITSYVAFLVVGVGSILFLITRNSKWDHLAYCSAEVGVLFASANIIMGMIWAKPIWGIWWTWDMRLTLQLLLALIFVAYLMLGAYISDPNKRANLQAVFGILGSVDVPVNYMAIRWWRTQHPAPVIGGGTDSGLDPAIALALAVSMSAFLIFYVFLLRKRLALAKMTQQVDYFEQLVLSR